MKSIITPLIIGLAGLSFANNTIHIPVPTQDQLRGDVVPGFILVKYKKDAASAIATGQMFRPVERGNIRSQMTFQSRLGNSGWIMYKIPSIVDPVSFADEVRKSEPGAITVENAHKVHTLLNPPNDPDFNAVEVDDGSGTYFLDFREDDSTPLSFRRDWHLDDIDALNAWSTWPNTYYTAATKPTDTPTIAIIDSGLDMNHPDFINAGGTGTDVTQGGQIDKSRSIKFLLGDVVPNGDPTDNNGHGTHVAGLALAVGNNGSYASHGTLGTGYSCKGMIVNCMQDNGSGLDSDVAGSIYWAADHGADVISVSLGSTSFNQVVQDSVTYATEKGCVVVCAGNEDGNGGGDLGPIWPAACSGSLGVTANGPDWQFASYSGYGWYVDLGSPGGDFQQVGDVFGGDGYYKIQFDWSTATRYPNYITENGLAFPPYTLNYSYLAGTSMACPVVSGALGNYMAMSNLRQGDWNNIKVYRAAELAAQSQGAPFGGWEPTNGFGFFDFDALMRNQDSRAAQIGGVEGILYDGGTPVANATIRARKWDPATGVLSGTTFTTSTYASGNYRFDGMAPGYYDVWGIAFGHRKDMYVQVKAGSDRSGVDFYCGTPVIDSDGPIVQRCNISNVSATGLTVSHFAYDPETRLEDVTFQVLNSSNSVVVNPSRVIFESATVNYAFGTTLANGSYTFRATYTNGEGYTTVVDRPFTIGSSTAPVSGTITLQSFGTTTNRDIVLQLRSPGTTNVIESYTLNVHNGSTFTINTTQRGNFDLAFKGAHFLRTVLTNVNITNSGVSGLAPSLRNGDCDGNNLVGTADFNAIRAAWGAIPSSSNWNQNCDLDGNGVIGTNDFNIMRAFWGQVGAN